MYCNNCGAKMEGGETFCIMCGNRVSAQSNASNFTDSNSFAPDGYINTGNDANSGYNNSSFAQPSFSISNEAFRRTKNKSIESVVVLAISLILLTFGIIMTAIDEAEVGALPLMIGFTMFFVWLIRFMNFVALRNMLWLKKRGMTNVGADINPRAGARLCAGINAFFETKQKILIPYSETIWVYKVENRAFILFIPIIKVQFLMAVTRDGKAFKLKAKPENFISIYEAHSEKFPKEFMTGFTRDNYKTY